MISKQDSYFLLIQRLTSSRGLSNEIIDIHTSFYMYKILDLSNFNNHDLPFHYVWIRERIRRADFTSILQNNKMVQAEHYQRYTDQMTPIT